MSRDLRNISQGTSAKADVPRGYLGKRVCVIITRSKGEERKEARN
jgi:hypothetical protein